MLLLKTDKARLELSPGVRTLSLRERSLLLLADGKPLPELQAMYNGGGAQIVEQLLTQGYLTGVAPKGATELAPTAAIAPLTDIEPATVAVPSHALKSLAGTRMYLFDICERMFARRNAQLAQNFHDALRNARDRDSMLDVGEALLDEITLLAGPERAASVRERMEQLLPA
ncbi:MAG: hypothetical protein EOO33_13600 [Comamonadaceae bacterium]|nr:MAG: hypothetical protein EOO33_13600 [Comamonadaceae bacterium]